MAFDQVLPIIRGTPQFNLLWSSQPTPSGHYVGAFINSTIAPRAGATAELLLGLLVSPQAVFNIGFVVLGRPISTLASQSAAASRISP